MARGLSHSQIHSTSPFDTNYAEKEPAVMVEQQELAKMRQEKKLLLQMLREQMLNNVPQEPTKVVVPAKTNISSTWEEPHADEVDSMYRG